MFVPHVVIKLLSVLGTGILFYLSHGLYLHCVSGVYVCSSCCDKAAVRSSKVVVLSLFVQCLLLPPLFECGLWVPLMLL